MGSIPGRKLPSLNARGMNLQESILPQGKEYRSDCVKG